MAGMLVALGGLGFTSGDTFTSTSCSMLSGSCINNRPIKVLKWIRQKTAGLRIRIHFIKIRIQHFRLNTDPDPIRI
jgi:hypothetical protein